MSWALLPFETSSLPIPAFSGHYNLWHSVANFVVFCATIGGILWLDVTSLQSPPLSSLGILLVSRFLLSYKDSSHVGFRAHFNPI